MWSDGADIAGGVSPSEVTACLLTGQFLFPKSLVAREGLLLVSAVDGNSSPRTEEEVMECQEMMGCQARE